MEEEKKIKYTLSHHIFIKLTSKLFKKLLFTFMGNII